MGRDGRRVRTSRRVGGLEQRVLPLGQNAINNHFGDVWICREGGYYNGCRRRAARSAEGVAKSSDGIRLRVMRARDRRDCDERLRGCDRGGRTVKARSDGDTIPVH